MKKLTPSKTRKASLKIYISIREENVPLQMEWNILNAAGKQQDGTKIDILQNGLDKSRYDTQ